jgi:NAD-dependent SIR2 family protein deacetylase
MIEQDFIKNYISNASQIMWFLGAGTSRTAGMPTAIDIIWDLKVKYYCREENQDIKNHDVNNEQVKKRIQSYMDSKGFPALWSPEEYSHYFDITFGKNYLAQQKYLNEQLHRDKISLNIGHRVLAGLIALKRVRLVFTTNFDEVVELACAKVAESPIPTFHLEGSYAAVNALNSEQFPIYAKVHGDFKYTSVKNLTADLLSNDKEIQRALIAAATRYGIILSGYSGRDSNVMSMLREAVDQNNSFPQGLFWTVTSLKRIEPTVEDFINYAKSRGVNAHIVETGTFDSMMTKIWRQIPDRTDALNKKVNTAMSSEVKIPMGNNGSVFPVVRLNALQVTSLPNKCALVTTKKDMSNFEVKEQLIKNKSRAIVTRADSVFAWGNDADIQKGIGENNISSISSYDIEAPNELVANSTLYHAFYERALAVALCDGRPITFRNDHGFVLTFDPKDMNDNLFQPLRNALANRSGQPGILSGNIPNAPVGTFWTEGLKIKLETRMQGVYLMLKPTIWIEPATERRNHSEFIKGKKRGRYNQVAYKMLDAWITILIGAVGKGEAVVTFQKESSYPAEFKISTRTSFSKR